MAAPASRTAPDRPPVEPGRAVAAAATLAGGAVRAADAPRRAALERSVAPAAGPACRPRAAPALAATTRGGTTGAAGRVGSGRRAGRQQARDAGDADGAASRDSWVTRERSSSISFSCDSTTRRSVSSCRARLARRHPGHDRQDEGDGEQDQREEKNLHCSSFSCRRSSAGLPIQLSLGFSHLTRSSTVADKLSLISDAAGGVPAA